MSRARELAKLADLPTDISKSFAWKPGTGWVEATGSTGYATDQELTDGLASKVDYLDSSQRIKLDALTAGGAVYIGGFDADGTTRKWYIGRGGTSERVYVYSDTGDVALYHAGALKLVTTTGGISVTGTVTATSDRKFKSNRRTIKAKDALTRFMQVKAKSFFFSLINKNFSGFIAQEVAEIYPNSVDSVKDEDGGHLVMTKDEIIADLVVIVQDQQRRLDRLEEILNDSAD